MTSVAPDNLAPPENPQEKGHDPMHQSGEYVSPQPMDGTNAAGERIPGKANGFTLERKSGIRQIPGSLRDSTAEQIASYLGFEISEEPKLSYERVDQPEKVLVEDDLGKFVVQGQLVTGTKIDSPHPEVIIAAQKEQIEKLLTDLRAATERNRGLETVIKQYQGVMEIAVQRAHDLQNGNRELHKAFEGASAKYRLLHEMSKKLELKNLKLQHGVGAKEAQTRECTCKACDFIGGTREVALNPAARLLGQAKEEAERKERSKRRKRNNVRKSIEQVLLTYYNQSIDSMRDEEDGRFSRQFKDTIKSQAAELAKELVDKDEVTLQDILQGFDEIGKTFNGLNVPKISGKQVLQADGEDLETLKELLGASKKVKSYLEKLVYDAEDIHVLKLEKVWQEKEPGNYLNQVAEKANYHCNINFSPHKLHSLVEETNDLNDLQKLTRTIPSSPEQYLIWRDAIAKINVMHLIISVESQVDFGQLSINYDHNRKFMDLYTRKLPNGQIYVSPNPINHPDKYVKTEDDKGGIIVDDIQLSSGKTDESMIRKLMKRVDSSKNYEVNRIEDMERDLVWLRKEDSESKEAFDSACDTLLGIVMSWRGTNTSITRLRYSYGTGKTNPSSTGKNEALQFTTRDRLQCEANGVDTDGHTRLSQCTREHQFKKYLPPELRDHDRDEYVSNQHRQIRELAGINAQFIDFVKDLIHAMHTEYDPDCAVKYKKDVQMWSTREKMLMTLFKIIGDCDENGIPKNFGTVRTICRDHYYLQQVKEIIADHLLVECKDEEPGYKGYTAKYLQNRGEVKLCSINILAAKAKQVLENECKSPTNPQLTLPKVSA